MILDDIVKAKREGLDHIAAYKDTYLEKFKEKIGWIDPPRDFAGALAPQTGPWDIRIIAETKKASPSKGVIREPYYPMVLAHAYQSAGAAAVSVLTEERFFLGSLDQLTSIKANLKIPVLRKDFILEEYQVWESRAAGADAVLLIAAILDDSTLKALVELTVELGMDPLVEVHDEGELDRALKTDARLIGINNRDLKTFTTDINTTVRLAAKVPEDRILVTESGINTMDDVATLRQAGSDAFLIGEALLREEDVAAKLRELRGVRMMTPEDMGYDKKDGKAYEEPGKD